jgi:Helicase HerA, central domain
VNLHELVADLLAEEIRDLSARGGIGALVEVPQLEADSAVSALQGLIAGGADLRVAYLLDGGEAAGEHAGLTDDVFDVCVERAEKWRNERGLDATIVVVASGDEARLSSLRDFEAITPATLKHRLAERARERFGEVNEVQADWWDILGRDTLISLTELADYFLALDGKPQLDVVDQATQELPRIGLLPDPELLNHRKQIMRRLSANRDVLQRLQTLSETDRKLIQSNIGKQIDPAARTALEAGFRRVQQLRRGKASPSLAEAQGLLGLRKADPASTSSSTRKPKVPTVAEAAASAVVDGDDAALGAVLDDLDEQLDKLDESSLKPVRLGLAAPAAEGETAGEIQVQARTDLVNLMARLAGPDAFGGHVRSAGGSVEEMVRRFAGDADVRHTWTLDLAREILGASEHPAVLEVRARMEAYAEAREEVLPKLRALAVAPLLVAGSPTTRAHLLALVGRYQDLLAAIDEHHAALLDEFGGDVDGLVGEILKLDVVLLEAEGRTMALLTPVHPLYIWHFAEFCRIVDEQREQLSERDHKLIKDIAAEDLPNFLSSLSLPPITGPSASVLPFVGRIGPVPYFASVSERNSSPDGIITAERLIRAYLDVFPPAAKGLRLTVLDAPDPSPYLLMLTDMAEDGLIEGAHLTALRHPRDNAGTDLGLDEDEEERVAQRFRAPSDARRFTYEIADVPEHRMLPADAMSAHVLIAVDQTVGTPHRLRELDQPLQPLVAARKLQFRTVGHRVELEAAHGGPFASYFRVAQRIGTTLGANDWDRHQDEILTKRLSDASRHAHWFVLADRHVDRDLDLDLLRIFTGREGDRDVVAFVRYVDPFRRALREVASQYNVAIDDHQLDDLLDDLTQLLDAGVLWLRTRADGTVDHNAVKGVLGTLIASRWWRDAAPEGHRRLVISLDDHAARKWLHLADDARRADLLGLDHGPDGLEVAAIEVKAVEAANAEYRIKDGRADGDAVNQVLSTRALLRDVFGEGPGADLVTSPARRELLRANAYRELSKGRYDGDARRHWVEVIETALGREGEVEVTAHLVDVQIGANPATLPDPIVVLAEDDVPVVVTVLNERGVDELRPPDPPAPDVSGPSRDEPPSPGEDVEPTSAERQPGPAETQTDGDDVAAEAEPKVVPVAEASTIASPASPEVPGRPVAWLGAAEAAYGDLEEIDFDPEKPGEELPNAHISITGETGSGKTQATKAILRDLMRGYGLPGLILDFKDDYSGREYTDAEGLTVQDASFGGLPFNPLEPAVDPASGRVNPMGHVHQIGEILKRVYRLGDQQTFHLREAIKSSYEQGGIKTSAHVPAHDVRWPTLDDVRPLLSEADHDALLGRLSPIFDLGLFTDPGDANLSDLLDGQVVIRLSQLPGDQVKNAVAEFLLLALYNHLIRLEQPRELRRLLVLDEAWRVTNSERLEPLMRESRAFGLGIIVATQYPNDLSDAVAGATATRLFFSQSLPDPIKAIQATLVGKSSGTEADRVASDVRSMRKLHCLMQNQQHRPYRRVIITPYWQRE